LSTLPSTDSHFVATSPTAPPAPPEPAPAWFAARIGASVDASRNLLAAWVFALAFLFVTVALASIARSRVVQPYLLQSDGAGAILPAAARLVPYQPGAPEKRYFLAQWVRHLLALDAHLSEAWLADAYQLTRGKATVEFTDWLRGSAPLRRIKDDPSLTRTVEILGISLIDDEVALVRVACEDRSLTSPAPSRRKWLVTLHFQAIPPASEAAILRNPIGLEVTDFQVGEDLEK
jgi:type IV secretion system protein VirB5